MAIKIMIGNHKGGAAKTQTALEMAYYLAKKRKRVLFIDVDPQANATKILSKDTPTRKRALPDILIDGDEIKRDDISSCNLDTAGHHIDYIASGLKAGRLESKLSDDTPKEYVLKDALDHIEKDYDFIIIDTPPSAEIVVINSLIASAYVLLTCNAAMFGSAGVDKLMPIISDALGKLKRRLSIDEMTLWYQSASEDPAAAALAFGGASAAAGALVGPMQEMFRIRDLDIRTAVSFTETKPKVYARLKMSVSLGVLLWIGLRAYGKFRRAGKTRPES